MSVGFDPSTDFEDITDGLEAVTLNRRGSTPNTSIANALRRKVTQGVAGKHEAQISDGQYNINDSAWHLPDAEVGNDPLVGDEIIRDLDSSRYTILQSRHDTLANRWRCVSRNVRVAFGLEDTIRIEQATYAKSTQGAAEPTWKVFRDGIRARIQPVLTDIAVENVAKRFVREVTIFIGEDLPITQNHRVVARDGTIYKITNYKGAERIGELAEIAAEVTPWPLS